MSLLSQITDLVNSGQLGQAIILLVDAFIGSSGGGPSGTDTQAQFDARAEVHTSRGLVDTGGTPDLIAAAKVAFDKAATDLASAYSVIPSDDTPQKLSARQEVESARQMSNSASTPDQITAAITAIYQADTDLQSAYPGSSTNPPPPNGDLDSQDQITARGEVETARQAMDKAADHLKSAYSGTVVNPTSSQGSQTVLLPPVVKPVSLQSQSAVQAQAELERLQNIQRLNNPQMFPQNANLPQSVGNPSSGIPLEVSPVGTQAIPIPEGNTVVRSPNGGVQLSVSPTPAQIAAQTEVNAALLLTRNAVGPVQIAAAASATQMAQLHMNEANNAAQQGR